jgi:hypothetical protein
LDEKVQYFVRLPTALALREGIPPIKLHLENGKMENLESKEVDNAEKPPGI